MNLAPLIQLTRGGTPECLHFGAVAVVNRSGQLKAWLDPDNRGITSLGGLDSRQVTSDEDGEGSGGGSLGGGLLAALAALGLLRRLTSRRACRA